MDASTRRINRKRTVCNAITNDVSTLVDAAIRRSHASPIARLGIQHANIAPIQRASPKCTKLREDARQLG
jgi:hypothetical protein